MRPVDVPAWSIFKVLTGELVVVLRVKAYGAEVGFTCWPLKGDGSVEQTRFVFVPHTEQIQILGSMRQVSDAVSDVT